MTVEELIEELKQFSPTLNVQIVTPEEFFDDIVLIKKEYDIVEIKVQ